MKHKYDVAISFAGEDRKIAEEIADKLKSNGIDVFYDRYEQSNLFGENLYERLHEIYSFESRYCLMLISKNYKIKVWTAHEWKSIQDRALQESNAYVLPVRIDDTELPGLRTTISYFDLQSQSVEELVKVVLQKINKTVPKTHSDLQQHSFSIPLPKIRKEFTERDRDRFIEESFQKIKHYFQQGAHALNAMDEIEATFTDMGQNRFSSKIYQNGKGVSECTIWYGSSMFNSNSISYISKANQTSSNSLNESLSVEASEGNFVFRAQIGMFSSNRSTGLTAEEGAEFLWNKLIEPLNQY